MQTDRRARSSMAVKKNKEIDFFFSHDHMTENMTTKIYFSFSHFFLFDFQLFFSHSFSIKREAHRMRVCKYLKMQSWGLKFEIFPWFSRDLKNQPMFVSIIVLKMKTNAASDVHIRVSLCEKLFIKNIYKQISHNCWSPRCCCCAAFSISSFTFHTYKDCLQKKKPPVKRNKPLTV